MATEEERREHRAWAAAAISLLFVVSAVAAVAAALWGLLGQCGIFGPPGAYASPQGGVCGERASVWNALPWAATIVGAAIPPAAAVVGYQRYDGVTAAVMGIGALLMCPILVGVAVTAPPDACSAEQRQELPGWACSEGDPDADP